MDEALIRARLDEALRETQPDFGAFFLLRLFGLDVSYGEETCTVRIPTSAEMFNPQGTSLHGGVLTMAVDISMGHLCKRFLSTCVTVDMDLKYLRPINGPARCEASFLKKGRRLVTVQTRVFDQRDRLAAFATATWYRLPEDTAADGDAEPPDATSAAGDGGGGRGQEDVR